MKRRYIASAVLVAAVTLGVSSQAFAAGESIGGCVFGKIHKYESEYGSLHEVEFGPEDVFKKFESDLEGCVEAPDPIIPELDEIIWGGAAFVILLAFMVWKGMPAVKGAMDKRAEKIRSDLDAADEAKSAAQRTQAEYEAQLADAKATAAKIVDEARESAEQVKRDLQARAEAEIAEQRSRATADIEASRRQAIDDLRGEVSAIAVGAAERVVGASLDAGVHSSLIDSYIDEVANSSKS